eukprot:SAG31_NODE_114_length_24318_cov_16.787481_11_plen_134_part_00
MIGYCVNASSLRGTRLRSNTPRMLARLASQPARRSSPCAAVELNWRSGAADGADGGAVRGRRRHAVVAAARSPNDGVARARQQRSMTAGRVLSCCIRKDVQGRTVAGAMPPIQSRSAAARAVACNALISIILN